MLTSSVVNLSSKKTTFLIRESDLETSSLYDEFINSEDEVGEDSNSTIDASSIIVPQSNQQPSLESLLNNLNLDKPIIPVTSNSRQHDHNNSASKYSQPTDQILQRKNSISWLSSAFKFEVTSDDNFINDSGSTDTKPIILYASKMKLIEKLTTILDYKFMDDFLVTLEMIMHPMDFATCLISRLAQAFNAVPGWNKSETIDQEVVKMRGLIVLQHWAGTYGSALETDLDFSIRKVIIEGIDLIWQQSFTLSLSDQRFLIKIRRLFDARGEISTTSPEDYENDQNQDFNDESSVFDSERVYYSAEEDEGQDHQVFGDFRKWRKRMKMRLKSIFSNSPKRSPASSGFNSPQSSSSLLINSFSSDAEFSEELSTVLMTDRSRNLANILGILEWDLFKAIQRSELVSFPVARESPHNLVESCPNLQRAIEHFNSMCRWFVQLVVNQDDGEPLLLAKLIRLAVKCVLIHNYNSALQIILALQSPAISARKDLWMALPTWERRLAKDLAVFGSPVKNFKNVRKALDEVQKEEVPVIPFTGLFLSDLVFNYERRSETQSNSSKTIPFYKNHLAAKVVRQFLAFQNPRHRFEKVLNGKERQLYSYFADIGRLGGEFSM